MQDEIILSNSAVETAETCPTKYYWRYVRRIVPVEEGDVAALSFGLAIHKGLEVRGNGQALGDAIEAFEEMFPTDLSPKHTRKAGKLILKEYYDRYEAEPVRVLENEKMYKYTDEQGWAYRGRIDKLIELGGEIMIMDHKTTSNLGSAFYASTKPNGQFSGYIFLVGQVNPAVKSLMVDGLLTPYPYKTKPLATEFQREVTTRSELELELWYENIQSIVCGIRKWAKTGTYPKYDRGWNCANRWQECPYRNLCLIPARVADIDPPKGLYKEREKEEE